MGEVSDGVHLVVLCQTGAGGREMQGTVLSCNDDKAPIAGFHTHHESVIMCRFQSFFLTA